VAKKPVQPRRYNGASKPAKPKVKLFDWHKFDPSMIKADSGAPLTDELLTYRDRLDELLKDKGKYVLIKGCSVVGIYNAREEALCEATRRFKGDPVLIKQIVAKEPVAYVGSATF
jgi:hypothetical protein